jgi:hypothetical protein
LAMLKSTTKMINVRSLNVVVNKRRAVKNRVERPIIMASVPSMENRSFHKLIYSFLRNLMKRNNL